jgi:hypothetical protein
MVMTVLLADLPRLLDEIVSGALEDDEGTRLVRDARIAGDLAAAALGVDADVVVVTREDPADLASIDQHMAGLAGRSLLALTPSIAAGTRQRSSLDCRRAACRRLYGRAL